MKVKLYIVSHSGPESYAPIFLEGPEVNDWGIYVESLMPEIKERAIRESRERGFRVDEIELRDAAVSILVEKGYSRMEIPSFDFLWLGNESLDPEIVFYNKFLELKDAVRMKAVTEESFHDIEERINSTQSVEEKIAILKEELSRIWGAS